jgi:hypothetical protein
MSDPAKKVISEARSVGTSRRRIPHSIGIAYRNQRLSAIRRAFIDASHTQLTDSANSRPDVQGPAATGAFRTLLRVTTVRFEVDQRPMIRCHQLRRGNRTKLLVSRILDIVPHHSQRRGIPP